MAENEAVVTDSIDPVQKIRRRIFGLMEKSLDVLERGLEGPNEDGTGGLTRSELECAKAIMAFAPKMDRDQGQPLHLHLSVPRPPKDSSQVLEAQAVPVPDPQRS